jgi:hypothetical protein
VIARRTLFASLTSPFVWRVRGHAARKLLQFSSTERGSELDLRLAAAMTTSPARRALYLKHALDESRHALAFAARANDLRNDDGLPSVALPEADIERLFETLGEVRFLAFVHRGEARGRAQFVAYRDHFAQRRDDKSRALFDAILRDEERHEQYTRALLVEVCGSEHATRVELRKAALWEAWRTWRRAGRFTAHALYTLLMTIVYVAMAPLALWVRLVRPERRGFVTSALPPGTSPGAAFKHDETA